MNRRRDGSRGSESIISLDNDAEDQKSIRTSLFPDNTHRNSDELHNRTSVQHSLKLVRDLITIIVSDEGNLDKLENIIDRRESTAMDSQATSSSPHNNTEKTRTSGGSTKPNTAAESAKRPSSRQSTKSNISNHGVQINSTGEASPRRKSSQALTTSNSAIQPARRRSSRSSIKSNLSQHAAKKQTAGPATMSHAYAKSDTSLALSQRPSARESTRKAHSSISITLPKRQSSQDFVKKIESRISGHLERKPSLAESSKKVQSSTSLVSARGSRTSRTSLASATNNQSSKSSSRHRAEVMQNVTNKHSKAKLPEYKSTDSLNNSEEKLIAVRGNTESINRLHSDQKKNMDQHGKILEAGTQTSYAELYADLGKHVADMKKGGLIASEVIAKIMPIKEELKAINVILSDVISKEKEAEALNHPPENDENNLENDPNDEPFNLEYYVVYDTSEDHRLKTWQRTLEAREKIAENIMAHTGKRPAEILFNRSSTMESQEKQMIQRLMEYSDRMNSMQNTQRAPSRLSERGKGTNRPLSEIQETVPRLRKKDIEISGVPDLVRQETMACAHNCPELRTQWMHSDVLNQRIHDKRRDLRRVIDNYPDISHLSVAGQRKPIQSTSYQMPAQRTCANHSNRCFCRPQYGAGTSGRVDYMDRMDHEK